MELFLPCGFGAHHIVLQITCSQSYVLDLRITAEDNQILKSSSIAALAVTSAF